MKKIFLILGLFLAISLSLFVLSNQELFPTKNLTKSNLSYVEKISQCLEKNFSEIEESSAEKNERGKLKHLVSLKSREFIPQENTNKALNCFDNLPQNEDYFAFLQTHEPLNQEEREELKNKGISLEVYIPQNAWFAKISKSFNQNQTEKLKDQVRWIGVIKPQDKMSEHVWEGKFVGVSATEKGTKLRIQFFDSVSTEKALKIIQESGSNSFEESRTSHAYYVIYDEEGADMVEIIRKLALENTIYYIDEVPPPATIPPHMPLQN